MITRTALVHLLMLSTLLVAALPDVVHAQAQRPGRLDFCEASLLAGEPAQFVDEEPTPTEFREITTRRLPPAMPPRLAARVEDLLAHDSPEMTLCRVHLRETIVHRHVQWGFGSLLIAGLTGSSVLSGITSGMAGGLNAVFGGTGFSLIKSWEWMGIVRALERHRDGELLEDVLEPEVLRARARGAAFGAVASAISAVPSAAYGLYRDNWLRPISIAVLTGHAGVGLAYGLIAIGLMDRADKIESRILGISRRRPPLRVAPFATSPQRGTWTFGIAGAF